MHESILLSAVGPPLAIYYKSPFRRGRFPECEVRRGDCGLRNAMAMAIRVGNRSNSGVGWRRFCINNKRWEKKEGKKEFHEFQGRLHFANCLGRLVELSLPAGEVHATQVF